MEIVIRFPSKKLADYFCGQMSDGFGEGFCDFSFYESDESGTYRKVTTDTVPKNTPVYFVDYVEGFSEKSKP